jgi:GDP-L-fucose synthase
LKISKDDVIYITGHDGMVGAAVVETLKQNGYTNLIFRTINELDLRQQEDVKKFFQANKPDIVIHLAARVGGIMANIKYPAHFIYDNLMIQTNVIHSAHENGCKKLLFLGSSCIYPKESPQPMKEEYLLTGLLEPTNQSYSIAKIAGIQMCQSYAKQYGDNFICPMPSNLYGYGDHFDEEGSHVLSAFISKFHKAKLKNLPSVTIWGTGRARREFLYVTDVANAIVFLLENYDEPDIINVGSGTDISIQNLAIKIKEIIGYKGEILNDTSKPDGMMKKLLDVSKMDKLGWKAKVSLDEGIKKSYDYYLTLL